MADIDKCQEELLLLAKKQGYLTFDDVINASDTFSLSVSDLDVVSDRIQMLGVIIYEDSPVTNKQDSNDELYDYSRTDYDAIFEEILEISPSMQSLIEQIKLFPPPQYGETNPLFMQVADGNSFARQRLITIYMRIVLKIALSMSKQYEFDLEDAISAGFMGLIVAVDRYDVSGFSAFLSYASMWIQQNIQRECNPVWIDYYFPTHIQEKMIKVIRKYEEYSLREKMTTSYYHKLVLSIADELDLSTREVQHCLTYALLQKYGKESLEELMEWGTEEESFPTIDDHVDTYFDFEISDRTQSIGNALSIDDNTYEWMIGQETKAMVERFLSILTPKEAEVIRMRYGIGYDQPMTLEAIGSILNVTRERVRQIETKAMRRLVKRKEYLFEGKFFTDD